MKGRPSEKQLMQIGYQAGVLYKRAHPYSMLNLDPLMSHIDKPLMRVWFDVSPTDALTEDVLDAIDQLLAQEAANAKLG